MDRRSFLIGLAPAAALAAAAPIHQALAADPAREAASPRATRSVLSFGAVPDGIDTGHAFEGTDNTAAFQAAIDYATRHRCKILVPAGFYRFAPGATEAATLTVGGGYFDLEGEGYGNTVLLIDEDLADTTFRDFLRTDDFKRRKGRDVRDLFRLANIELRGRWSHQPGYPGVSFVTIDGFARVVIDAVRASDSRGRFSRSRSCGAVAVTNSVFERLASDGIRFIDTPNVLVHGNTLRAIDDDAIALHSGDETGDDRKARSSLVVTDNILEDCEGAAILGPRMVVFSGNTLRRTRGTGILVGSSGHPEGSVSQGSLIVANNIVEDALKRHEPGRGWVAAGGGAAITVGGGLLVANGLPAVPGAYAGGVVIDPIPFMHTNDWRQQGRDASVEPGAGTHNTQIVNNVVARTLAPVAAYSDWGFGRVYHRDGWQDPPVTEDAWHPHGVKLLSDSHNARVGGNTISGCRRGAAVFLDYRHAGTRSTDAFANILVQGNTVRDCRWGVRTSRGGDNEAIWRCDLTVDGNLFDLDPYHQQPQRSQPLDGSWLAEPPDEGPPCCAVVVNNCSGVTVVGNTVANAFAATIPADMATVQAQAGLRGNRLKCQPAAVGFSPENKGIAHVPSPAGGLFSYMIVDGNPASPRWREVLNTCVDQAEAVPTAGTYVQGHFVHAAAPVLENGRLLLGWARLTTGGGHEPGVDWATVFAAI